MFREPTWSGGAYSKNMTISLSLTYGLSLSWVVMNLKYDLLGLSTKKRMLQTRLYLEGSMSPMEDKIILSYLYPFVIEKEEPLKPPTMNHHQPSMCRFFAGGLGWNGSTMLDSC